MNKEVDELIKTYAKVYSEFERLQLGDNEKSILPTGDQKTGVIGEYYAKLYIEKTFTAGKEIGYQKPGAKSDLVYEVDGKPIHVQVKAVSAHSKTRTISPIKLFDNENKPKFDKLFLIALDVQFYPCGFWINEYEDIRSKASKKKRNWLVDGAFLKGKSLHGKESGGSSTYLDFSNDRIADLIDALK